jgi:hypothetical protein
MGLMLSLTGYRSPLHADPPKPGAALSEPRGVPSLTRRVVFVLVDGLRLDTSLDPEVMPFLASVRARGATATMHSRTPSYSVPAWGVLLIGAWPELSDAPAMNQEYGGLRTLTQDNLFSAAHRSGISTAISAYRWFEKLIPQDAVGARFYTDGEDQAADREVVEAALPWLESGAAQLVLIHLDQVDWAGHHEGGPRDPQWDAAAGRVDVLLREIAAPLDLSRDTLLVSSDHGHIDRGGHGGQDAAALLEPMVFTGAGIRPGVYGDVQMVDLAPTVAALLGANVPASSQGRILTQMLALTSEQAASLESALTAQQSRLLTSYLATQRGRAIPAVGSVPPAEDPVAWTQATLAAVRSARLRAERWPRAVGAGLFLLVLVSVLGWQRGRELGWLLLGGLAYLTSFHLAYAVIGGRTYSMSSWASPGGVLGGTALRSFVAMVVSGLIVWIGLRVARHRPRRAAELMLGLTLIVCSLLALPVLLHTVVNGPLVAWTLPEPLTMFLGLQSLMQVLFVVPIGLLLAGVAALAARRR